MRFLESKHYAVRPQDRQLLSFYRPESALAKKRRPPPKRPVIRSTKVENNQVASLKALLYDAALTIAQTRDMRGQVKTQQKIAEDLQHVVQGILNRLERVENRLML